MDNFLQFAILGLGAGAAYALLAQGVVLIYRGSGLVNFGQGALAMLAAYITFLSLEIDRGWATLPAAVVGILAASLVSLAFQVLVLRQLRRATAIVRLIATLGLLSVVQAGVQLQWGSATYDIPQFLPHDVYQWGNILVQEERIIMLAVVVFLTAALWAFSRYTRLGLAISASAQNERVAATLGWSPERLSAITWTAGGALAGLAGVLVAPLTGLTPSTFTLVVTIAGLAAALLGGFSSFPLTLLGGLLIGVGESLATLYQQNITDFFHQTTLTGVTSAVPFLVILLVLVVRGRGLPLRSHVADRLPRLGSGLVSWQGLAIMTVGIMLLNFGVFNDRWTAALSVSLSAAVMVASIVVLTGFAGQLSLGQWALAGIGALIAGRLVQAAGWPTELAILGGILLTVPAGLLFALPALRTRGVNLAVVTLGLGFTVSQVVFANPNWIGKPLDGGTVIGPTKLFGIAVDSVRYPERWAAVCLVAAILVGLMVANLRRSRTGRRLLAIRTNERAAASLGISVFGAKLYAFGLASGIAAVAGILVAFQQPTITYGAFNVFASINSVGQAVIGGLGYVLAMAFAAPNAIGGVGTRVLEDFLHLATWDFLLGGVLLLAILIVHPDGLADGILRQTHGFLKRLRLTARPRPPEVLSEVAAEPVAPMTLRVSGLTVRFGGVVAVNDVTFEVGPGEVVGLIGPNGAGKTTIIDAVTGFVRATSGSVMLDSQEIGRWSAARRARGGLRRSFQSLELFDEITVADNIHVGGDESTRLSWLTDLIRPGNPVLPPMAVAAIREFDLGADLARMPDELPTGRRRLVGIARAVASGPSQLMLDEPAAGLDESESRELSTLIRRLARERNIGILLVEHDVGLVMSTCDRVIVLDFGSLIATGTPGEIRDDPKVRAAYLGELTEDAPTKGQDVAEESAAAEEEPSQEEEAPAEAPVLVRGDAVTQGDTLLSCSGLSTGYGRVAVVHDLDLTVRAGEVVALLGPNGAGKTTTLLCLSGELAPLEGEVSLFGSPTTEPMFMRCRKGLGYVTEERSAIMNLTAAENLRVAGVSIDAALEAFPELEPLLRRRAGLLSGGEQQMLTLARALGRQPKILLADELSLGLAPRVVTRLLTAVRKAATEQGVGVLLVEQHVSQALAIADRVVVLQRGSVALSGTAAEVGGRLSEVESAYLSSTS
jgi:ABC-type branched-subunit amino acid transport system ATPase component/branched-subunit amino acid ABC-type transport system permease component